MIQIRKPNDTLLKVLNQTRKSASEHYRLLTFCLQVDTADGLLLYNTLTGEILLLDKQEQSNLVGNDELRAKWFVVPLELDDLKLAKQIRQMMKLLLPQCPVINSYTILPTTDCNARCFYCYEKGCSKVSMSEETAVKLSDWMVANYQKFIEWTAKHQKNCSDNKQQPSISLHWFGGEPLYNIPAIDAITSRLQAANVVFSSAMTSNSYLFDENLVEKAIKQWHLKSIQVTLDGTEEVYNRCKAFIYPNSNAYQRVMRNIGLLLHAGIFVSVRLNIDVHNADNLMELADVLHAQFGSYKNFNTYSHPLFELDGNESKPRSAARRAELYKRYQALQDKLTSLGLFHGGKISIGYRASSCMADSPSSVMVLPTGNLGRCEHYPDTNYHAHLDNPQNIDTAMYHSFEAQCDDLPTCSDCAYYPQCTRLKRCTVNTICYPETKADRINQLKHAVLISYERWKTKQAEPDEASYENINC